MQENSSIKAFIVSSMEEYEYETNGILSYTENNSSCNFIKQINLELINLVNKYKNTYILDINKIIYELGINNVYNYKMKYISRDPYNIDVYVEMSKLLNRIIGAIYYRTKKLIVVDLDNTLYGGVLGEDGIDGIKLSDEYPGDCYKKFQKTLKNLKDKGFLLAISSKNNYDDVKKLFEHKHMILKENDFVSIKANWEDKYINIKNITKELNIGLNSVVFIDDSEYELEYVKKELPEIETIKIPGNVIEISRLLEQMNFFDKISITEEDKNKTNLYHIRKYTSNSNGDIDEFLKDLNIEIKFKILKEDNKEIERASEMTLKTNQFNMTTKRYTLSDIKRFVKNDKKLIIMMNVKDKFGEYGNVGLAIVDVNDDIYSIDTFLLSCRILKRKLEYCMLEYIAKIARQNNIKKIIGQYIQTSKNQQFKDFYYIAGFELKNEKFEFDLRNKIKNVPEYIKIE